MPSPNPTRLSDAFDKAKLDFLTSLKDPSLFNSIATVTSIDEVYAFTTQLQQDQSKRHGLRNLLKIKPFLDRLKEFASAIDVLVSAKPEILALIWGPIKFLLQMSDNLTKSFDAIVEAMAVIGNKLPLFEAHTMLFKENDRVAQVLVLFYKDILDFYEIVLNFFSAKRWVFVFDSVWPRHKDKIGVVVSSIEQHCLLMTDEVTLENISGAYRARVEDMKRWQRQFEFHERQDFKSVEDYISPRLYDDELDRLQRTICERTGRWLQREKTLKKWTDTSDGSTKVVWLQGIPGAGKTHISSMIVDKLRGLSHTTLFAFLSYRQGNTSTVSIIHSLIFQLVIGMEHFDEVLKQDLRAKLFHTFQSSQRNLKSNTRFARETLTELLSCVGPTYIIIDGLDELLESDRRVEILKELLDMLKVSTETRLLVSSRAQDEIAAVLKTTPKIIRVNDNNSGCIQAYVSVKSESWLTESGFDEHACSEIRSLLIPLAKKAKGMFLYARVVMDNIQMCHTADQVQNELAVLPESLDEAYARVFQRLNDLPHSSKEMSRRALGWIGCSPIPIKIQELSFALSLNPDGEGELPRSENVINIVRLCGPIVETLDDHVYFVHFTAKEYLFDKQDNQFVRELEANLDMAKTCLHYLSLNIFEVDSEPDTIKQNILSGSYRLHWFAATQWVVLVQNCAKLLRNGSPPDDLLRALSRFAHECENGNYETIMELDSQQSDEFQIFRDSAPNIHELLHQELHFRRLDVGDWKLEEVDQGIRNPTFSLVLEGQHDTAVLSTFPALDDSWTNLDPFYLTYASLGIYEQFESLLCPKDNHIANCNCPKLKRLYGDRLFRCKYHICQPQQISFQTKSAREAHCAVHDRAYKCTYPSCDFSTLGFSSSSDRMRHISNCHPDAPLKSIQMIKNPDDDELVPLLSDMIAMGMITEVEALYPRFKKLDVNLQRSLIHEAAFSGTLRIFQYLFNRCERKYHTLGPFPLSFLVECILGSIKGENIDTLKWLIHEHLAPKFSQFGDLRALYTFMQTCVNAESTEVFEVWKMDFKSYQRDGGHAITFAITTVKDPAKQERLATVLSEQATLGHLTTSDLDYSLKLVASSTCSVPIAKVLLEYGAVVDFRTSKSRKDTSGKTPLMLAAAKRTREGAEMMKFLILAGADPNALYQHKRNLEPTTAGMERGAQNVSKWLGMTWDELVQWAVDQRSRSTSKNEE